MEQQFALDGTALDPTAVANPCGLIAKSTFNGEHFDILTYNIDTFQLNFSDGMPVLINQSQISWYDDYYYNYKPLDLPN